MSTVTMHAYAYAAMLQWDRHQYEPQASQGVCLLQTCWGQPPAASPVILRVSCLAYTCTVGTCGCCESLSLYLDLVLVVVMVSSSGQ